MTDELIAKLRRAQRIAEAMRGLMHEVQASAPMNVHGKDATGAVTVILDAQGIPFRIMVAADWRQRLGAATLDAAVMDANGNAAQARMEALARALQNGVWAGKLERMIASGTESPPTAVPELLRRKAEPRSLGDLSDEMVKAFDGIRPQVAKAPRFRGVDRRRTVAITLDATGMTGCQVLGSWAGRQPGMALTASLNEALTAARAAARAAATRNPSPAKTIDTLIGETLSLLDSPEKLDG